MTRIKEIHSTEVIGVKAPRLSELKSRECSLSELQAALVQLIEIININQKGIAELSDRVSNKEDREWRATI